MTTVRATEPLYYLCEWTSGGRNHQRIDEGKPYAPCRACGSREACEAAQRLLYPPEWEQRQEWRRRFYEATGRYIYDDVLGYGPI